MDVPAILSRESKSFDRRLHMNKLKMPPHKDDVAKKAVPVLETKTWPKRPSLSINTSSAGQYDFLPRPVSGDMRDEHRV